MKISSDFRSEARESLKKNIFSSTWMILVLANIIMGIILGVASWFTLGIVSFIFSGVFYLGIAYLTTEASKKKNIEVSGLFEGFKSEYLGKAVLLGILENIYTFLWSLLFVIPGIIKAFSYSMIYFIAQDKPELTANETITESRRIMDGNKGRLFCLYVSFIGWFCVSILTLGLGFIWLTPYVQQAKREFYNDIKKESYSEIQAKYEEVVSKIEKKED